jgi:hypothetical protein
LKNLDELRLRLTACIWQKGAILMRLPLVGLSVIAVCACASGAQAGEPAVEPVPVALTLENFDPPMFGDFKIIAPLIPNRRGAFKIAENESPVPQDRVYVNYNFFDEVKQDVDVADLSFIAKYAPIYNKDTGNAFFSWTGGNSSCRRDTEPFHKCGKQERASRVTTTICRLCLEPGPLFCARLPFHHGSN